MATASHEHRKTDRGLLRNTNFVLLWCAYGVSAMGDHLSEMAILNTQDALDPQNDITVLSARMTFTFFVPFFLLAPVAGMLADRLPRRLLMISADLIRCVILFFFAVLISWTGALGSWGPFLPLLPVGLFAAVFSPARCALLPTLIQPTQLVRANGLISGLGIIATMAAAGIGGYLADNYVPTVAFRLDAATYLASAAFLAFLFPPRLHTRPENASRPAGAAGQLLNGFRYVRTHRRVIELIAVAMIIWFCGGLLNSVMPAVVRDVYGGTYSTISMYRVLLGVGFVIGAIIITTLGDALRSEITITWGLFGIGVAMGLFAGSVFLPLEQSTAKALGAVGVVAAGIFGVGVMASFNALLQRIVPDRFRGRVFGVKDVAVTGSLLLATGLLGLPQWTRVDRWVGYILIGVAVMTFVAGMVTLSVRLGRGPYEGKGLTLAGNFNEFICRFWYRMRRVGPSTIPREGPVIITANHRCTADPLLLHAAAPYRTIAFMVAAEYTNFPIARYFLKLIDCIPVKRDRRDTLATKQAIRHIRAGKALGIFIEGGIVAPGGVPKPRDGVAMLALRTGAKVIPAHISGVVYRKGIVQGLLARHRARIRFGPPVDLSGFPSDRGNREVIRAATREIYAAILALAPADETSLADARAPESVDLSGEQLE